MGRSSESHRRSVNEPNGQTYSSADGVAALPRRRRFADPYVYRSLSTHPSSPGAPSSLDRRLRITNDFPGTRATRKSLAMRKFYHNFSRLRLYFWTERYLRSATSQDTLGFRFRSNNRRKKYWHLILFGDLYELCGTHWLRTSMLYQTTLRRFQKIFLAYGVSINPAI